MSLSIPPHTPDADTAATTDALDKRSSSYPTVLLTNPSLDTLGNSSSSSNSNPAILAKRSRFELPDDLTTTTEAGESDCDSDSDVTTDNVPITNTIHADDFNTTTNNNDDNNNTTNTTTITTAITNNNMRLSESNRGASQSVNRTFDSSSSSSTVSSMDRRGVDLNRTSKVVNKNFVVELIESTDDSDELA